MRRRKKLQNQWGKKIRKKSEPKKEIVSDQPVIMRRTVIINEEEEKKVEPKVKPKKSEVGFIEKNRKKDYNIVYRNKQAKPMSVAELFGIPSKEEPKQEIKQEEKRLQKIIDKSELVDEKKTKAEQEKMRDLVIASDNFVAYRPQFSLHTIIAGFPWFLDWGRDTLIAFEGLLLKTKRYDIAKEVLLMMTRDIKFGLIPNGYSGYDSRPLYNSVDSSLLLFEQINKYLEYTNDIKFVKKK